MHPLSETKKRNALFVSLVRRISTRFARVDAPRSETKERSSFASLARRIYKPDSVIDSHASGMNVAIHLKRLSFRYPIGVSEGTALHRGKSLAVAPACCHAIHPIGVPILSELASLFASRASRRTGVTCYLSPFDFSQGCVRTFLHRFCPPQVATESSALSLSKGFPSTLLGTLNFVAACGRQNWRRLSDADSIIPLFRNGRKLCTQNPQIFPISACCTWSW